MEAVVEFQSFKDNNNRFIIKELAIVGEFYRTQIVFSPPYGQDRLNDKMQRTARWLSRHFHNIKWDAPGVPYNEKILKNLLKPFEVIHTKGLEKAEFLREFHPNVLVIEECLHVNSSFEVDYCIIHSEKNKNCALRSAEFYAWELFRAGLNKNKGPCDTLLSGRLKNP